MLRGNRGAGIRNREGGTEVRNEHEIIFSKEGLGGFSFPRL
jgi:hypothetical protein